MRQAASGLPRAGVLSGVHSDLSLSAARFLLQLRSGEGYNVTFGRYLVQTDVCEGRFVMTRITILAAAAAAVILIGIAALNAEPRWGNHATAGLQPVAQEHSRQ